MQKTESKQPENYYQILGVDKKATREEIKRAFRHLAKKYHPAADRHITDHNEAELEELMAAYKVLTNARERARYDALIQTLSNKEKKQVDDLKLKRKNYAQLFFDLLLKNQDEKALQMYEEIGKTDFNIEEYLSKRDYLDCMFLVGELLENHERFEEAAQLYEELYKRESKPPRNRYFFDELEFRLKRLYSRTLPQSEDQKPESALKYYKKVLDFELNRGEKAFIFKKIAETYLEMNDEDRAKKFYDKALELKPGLKGTAMLRDELDGQIEDYQDSDFSPAKE